MRRRGFATNYNVLLLVLAAILLKVLQNLQMQILHVFLILPLAVLMKLKAAI